MKNAFKRITLRFGGILGIILAEILLWAVLIKFFGWWSIPIMIAVAIVLGIAIAFAVRLYDYLKS